jgi:hypothetical protein
MKKSILNIGKTLNKVEQKQIQGGGSCPQVNPNKCNLCGGFSIPNGCCVGDAAVYFCLGLPF